MRNGTIHFWMFGVDMDTFVSAKENEKETQDIF